MAKQAVPPTVPIIVLSGRAGSEDKVAALDAGADDYITNRSTWTNYSPVSRAVIPPLYGTHGRRSGALRAGCPQVGRRDVNVADRTVMRDDGTDVRLTLTQWAMLDKLLRHPLKLISQRQLLHDVWRPEHQHETATCANTWPSCANAGGRPARPRHLITEPGMGYRYRS